MAPADSFGKSLVPRQACSTRLTGSPGIGSRWLQTPRLRSNEPGQTGRRATWLELFYDLIYVVVVAALGAELAGNVTPLGLLGFVALFVPVWWSWSGVTFYNDRFDTDDAIHRGATLLQMLAAVALALSIQDAFAGPGFVLAYVALRAILVGQYLRVGRHVAHARPLCVRYATGFGAAALLWLASLLVPAPWRFAVWAVAMVVDVGTPLTARSLQAKMPVSTSHLPERIGLFTIIVLGEGVAAGVRGASGPTLGALLGALIAISIAFGVWWVYFDNLDEHVVRRTRVAGQVWFYSHLPLVVGLGMAAVGAEGLVHAGPAAVLDAGHRWLLGGGLALVLGALAAIHASTIAQMGDDHNRRRALLRAGSALLALALTAALAYAPAWALGGALAAVALAQVAVDPAPQRAPVAS